MFHLHLEDKQNITLSFGDTNFIFNVEISLPLPPLFDSLTSGEVNTRISAEPCNIVVIDKISFIKYVQQYNFFSDNSSVQLKLLSTSRTKIKVCFSKESIIICFYTIRVVILRSS